MVQDLKFILRRNWTRKFKLEQDLITLLIILVPINFKKSLDVNLYVTQFESHYQSDATANIRPMQS